MKTEKRLLGDAGEETAAKYLRKNGHRILERNYICGKYEIDIIAENKEFLLFVEVKTRTYDEENIAKYGRACMAVDREKQRCLLAAARAYHAKHGQGKKCRMDIIEVYFDKNQPPQLHSINHMPDAFRAK